MQQSTGDIPTTTAATMMIPPTSSMFERLENARISSAEMQDDMSKLSSFFDKYSKDKRFRIQDGWLRIKEESIQLLYKRSKLIEGKLHHISTEYENLFEDLSCSAEKLKAQFLDSQTILLKQIESLSAELLKQSESTARKDKAMATAQATMQAMSASWMEQNKCVQSKAQQQKEKNAAIQSTFETQVQTIEQEFFKQTDQIDALLVKAKSAVNSSKSGIYRNNLHHQQQLWNLENLSSMLTMPPQLFDKISPINRLNKNQHINLREKDLNLPFRSTGNASTPVAATAAAVSRSGTESDQSESYEESHCSHLSTSKNEGKWESRFESPSANRDAQVELKKAILFLADHMEMLNGVNNLSDCEKSGHIELLLHHIQSKVREQDDNGNHDRITRDDLLYDATVPRDNIATANNINSSSSSNNNSNNNAVFLRNMNSDAFKKKGGLDNEKNNINNKKTLLAKGDTIQEDELFDDADDSQLHQIMDLQTKIKKAAAKASRASDAHNSILDLVHEDLSFQSRLPSLPDQYDEEDDDRRAFQNHVLQEDLLKVRQLNDESSITDLLLLDASSSSSLQHPFHRR